MSHQMVSLSSQVTPPSGSQTNVDLTQNRAASVLGHNIQNTSSPKSSRVRTDFRGRLEHIRSMDSEVEFPLNESDELNSLEFENGLPYAASQELVLGKFLAKAEFVPKIEIFVKHRISGQKVLANNGNFVHKIKILGEIRNC